MTWLRRLWRSSAAVVETAMPRDAHALGALHQASFYRGWGEAEFLAMIGDSNTLVHRLRRGREIVGFAVSRMAADEAELLSIAIAKHARGAGLSRDLLHTHLGHLAGRGVRKVFLEVEENNAAARRLYARAYFAQIGRRERYYREANGAELNAITMRCDLS